MGFEAIAPTGGGAAAGVAPPPPPPAGPVSVERLADQLAQLRATDPGAAASAQRQAEQGLTPVDRGRLAAALETRAAAQPAWRQAVDAALQAPGAYAAFQRGVGQGVLDGAKSLVVGTVSLVGRTLQFGADSGLAGWAGDRLRGVTGTLPGPLEAVVPSASRGAQTAASLQQTANAVLDYASSRAAEPHKLIEDTQAFIARNWDSLRADHAAAAARGPQAEAEWFGRVAGRAAFEIGITVVPVAGQAGRVAGGARAVEGATEGVRLLEAGTAGTRAIERGAGGGAVRTVGEAAAGAPRGAIIVTPRGVALTPELLRLQGTSARVGDFIGIRGATVEEIVSRVPRDWQLLPQQQGMGVRFVDAQGAERLRLHGPSTRAPVGSNSAEGWTARVHAPNNQYYDTLGNIVGPRDNAGHIPIYGNPAAGR